MAKLQKNLNQKLFNDIDIKLLLGMECCSANKFQKNYLENLKVQTKNALMNKKFQTI